MKRSKEIKYHYDADLGVYVKESEISLNWLLSEVLEKENLQITKISDEEVERFLVLLQKSDLRMPDGRHSLYWIKDKLEGREKYAKSQTSEAWYNVYERYKFIREQIDMILVGSDIVEYDENKKLKLEKINRTPNKMEAHFEPLKKDDRNA